MEDQENLFWAASSVGEGTFCDVDKQFATTIELQAAFESTFL